MNTFTLSVKGILRRHNKVLSLILIVAIASASVVVLSSLISRMKNSVEVTLDTFGANILITPKTDTLTLQYGGVSVGGVGGSESTIEESSLAAIDGIKNRENLRVISPKLIGSAAVNGENTLIVGVNFEDELDLQKHWSLSAGKKPASDNDLLVGATVAKLRGLTPGSEVALFGASRKVAGVLDPTGGPEDSVVYADLAAAQSGLGQPGRVSFVEVSALCNTCPIKEIVEQISAVVPGVEVKALSAIMKKRMETISAFTRYSGIIIIALTGLTLLVVALTFSSAVQERTREIGILMAIGYRGKVIGSMFVLEAMIVCGAGSLIGSLAGAAAMRIFQSGGAAFNPVLPALTILTFTVIGMAACVPPSLMAVRVDPARALRSI